VAKALPHKHLQQLGSPMTTENAIKKRATALIHAAQTSKKTLCTAESCTGGWIGKALTDVPGSSSVFIGGMISYANEAKIKLLGIPPEIIEFYGAVSEPVARAMAQQARETLDTDIAVSVTGIAGPSGGSSEKPVGTIWFGVSTPSGTQTYKKTFEDKGREYIRIQTVLAALRFCQEILDEN
jgi:PncC family amidohydrolase